MSFLSGFKDGTRIILAKALLAAGTNDQGVRDALHMLSGKIFEL